MDHVVKLDHARIRSSLADGSGSPPDERNLPEFLEGVGLKGRDLGDRGGAMELPGPGSAEKRQLT